MSQIVSLIFINNGETVQKIAVSAAQPVNVLVGNGKATEKTDVVFVSDFISRRHARVTSDAQGSVFIEDLGSTNGTFVNGAKLNANTPQQVKASDKISFSQHPGLTLVLEAQVAEQPKGFAGERTIMSGGATNPPVSTTTTRSFGGSLEEKLRTQGSITIGRSVDCDLVLDDPSVSRKHAVLERVTEGKYLLKDMSRNGTYINGKLVTVSASLTASDKISIGGTVFSISDKVSVDGGKTMIGIQPDRKESKSLAEWLQVKNPITIGRSADCDIVLDDTQISRHHTEISKDGSGYWVRDLGSTNGSYLNGQLVKGKVKMTEKDLLLVGLHAFRLHEGAKNLNLEVAISAQNIEKKYPNGYVGLKKMSVNIPHKAFVALMGPSGCGKTTLMKVLNGDGPSTAGKVYIHGLELEANYNVLKRKIGYVPQDDIVHRELTVDKSLYFAAKLRLPDDTTEETIKQRIEEVLTSLNINDAKIRSTKVGSLSGGQRKRVSIAVELLNKPSILFLDEPTSPLDPETIEEFLNTIKKLTEEGMTVVMVTHKPEDLNYVDRVIFMATKGYHSFYGDKGELLGYFGTKDIIGVYSLLSKPGKEEVNVKGWYDKWYRTQEEMPIHEAAADMQKQRSESLIRQFWWLSRRYLNIKINDPGNMLLLMAQPLVISVLLIFIFDKLQLGVLFLMAIASIWFGVSNAAKEIVGEIPIYKRERMFNLNIFTYLFSKILVLSIIALVQVLIFITITYFRYAGDELHLVYVEKYGLFMFYLAFSASLLGLLLSSIFDTTEKVMTVVPIALMPQIMLAGVITRVDNVAKEILSYVTLGRWGTEGFCRIQDSYADFKVVDTMLYNRVTDTVYKEIKPCGNDFVKMNVIEDLKISYSHTPDTIAKSLYSSIPRSSQDTLIISGNDTIPYTTSEMIDQKSNALNQLGFYDEKLISDGQLLGIFDSFDMNLMAVTGLNIVIFGFLIWAMKRKDSM